jgi:hypothetical protein
LEETVEPTNTVRAIGEIKKGIRRALKENSGTYFELFNQ